MAGRRRRSRPAWRDWEEELPHQLTPKREVLRYESLADRSRFSMDRKAEAFIGLSALEA